MYWKFLSVTGERQIHFLQTLRCKGANINTESARLIMNPRMQKIRFHNQFRFIL